MSAVERLIATYIAETLIGDANAVVDPDENLFTGGYVDSVGIMLLVSHIEAAFGIRVPPTDLIPQNFRTIRSIAGYLERVQSGV